MPRIEPRRLRSFVAALAESLGARRSDADALATSLVAADLSGHRSHGSRLLPVKYRPEIDEGKISPGATPQRTFGEQGFVRYDGKRAFGQIVARQAIDDGIAAAREHGVGVATLWNVSHIGRVGEWAERVATADMAVIGFVSNPGSRWVAPPGSGERRFSTNPIVLGLPAFDALPFPLVLDIATAQIARSRIREHDTSGDPLADAWTTDADGAPVTDPAAFEDGDGAILPLGGRTTGHKGFGLSVMAELLGGIFSGGTVSGMAETRWGNHAVFYITDLERVTTRAAVESRITAMAEYVRDTTYSSAIPTPPTAGGEEALLPGEYEYRIRKTRQREGLPIRDGDVAVFTELAEQQGLADEIPAAFQ